MSASPFFRPEAVTPCSGRPIRYGAVAAIPERTAVRDYPGTGNVPETDNRTTGSAWLSWLVSDSEIRSVRSFG
ncbi:hypothetical protein [Coprobacter fastidiosus]|uniref:hypothetical protein n=1 Tax=Coprobacter fastidiosus TaxID=1099853 RepID=UPI002665BEA7|nr:hypothetical protein [Coprobacter fastidiosus]